MKTHNRIMKPATNVPTDAEVKRIVLEWVKNKLQDSYCAFGEYVGIEITATTNIGSCDSLLMVATKGWTVHNDGDPLPSVYTETAER